MKMVFVTPRPRGRSAIYSMARTPYARIYRTSTLKGGGHAVQDEPSSSTESAIDHSMLSGSTQEGIKHASVIVAVPESFVAMDCFPLPSSVVSHGINDGNFVPKAIEAAEKIKECCSHPRPDTEHKQANATIKEKEFLISNLLKSEKELVEHAIELRVELENAASDVSNLFSKIERKVLGQMHRTVHQTINKVPLFFPREIPFQVSSYQESVDENAKMETDEAPTAAAAPPPSSNDCDVNMQDAKATADTNGAINGVHETGDKPVQMDTDAKVRGIALQGKMAFSETEFCVANNVSDDENKGDNADSQDAENSYHYGDDVQRSPRDVLLSNDFNMQNLMSCPVAGDGFTISNSNNELIEDLPNALSDIYSHGMTSELPDGIIAEFTAISGQAFKAKVGPGGPIER
ncbi:hypothetical protein KIW84_020953 [Lathyrus oleraceus]|uniref:Uncharacterized protein n=1 Tax=Pisum sativum TaxID=3888 RepID=A0A9D5B8M9_PEA|nr:hypothetical protein KIW84_020953 [Pisum sativum]